MECDSKEVEFAEGQTLPFDSESYGKKHTSLARARLAAFLTQEFLADKVHSTIMSKLVSGTALYQAIRQKSSETKEILWVCSSRLGLDAHEILSQQIAISPPANVRFVFAMDETAVIEGEANPYEAQYFVEHFQHDSVRTFSAFNSNIFIFDNSALITSASFTKADFESNLEIGVILEEDAQVKEAKAFFDTLWENAKPIKDVRKFKKAWGAQKVKSLVQAKVLKSHTKIEPWKDDYVATWYFSIPSSTSKRTIRKIQKEACWPKSLNIVVDIGPSIFKQIKLGDLALIANFAKKRDKVTKVEFARAFDKSRVETEDGDLHFAYELKQAFQIDRSKFYELLKSAGIEPKSTDVLLTQSQTKILTAALFSVKTKKKRKHRSKTKTN